MSSVSVRNAQRVDRDLLPAAGLGFAAVAQNAFVLYGRRAERRDVPAGTSPLQRNRDQPTARKRAARPTSLVTTASFLPPFSPLQICAECIAEAPK